MKTPINIAITGASGNIGYSIIFRIASGGLFGPDQPINLHLIEIEPALSALTGVEMELLDCAFPTINKVVTTSDLSIGFGDAEYIFLIGSKPRSKGMERKDLLRVNGHIFKEMGKAISDYATKDVRVLVVGNPANTNALIAIHNAPNLSSEQITSMMRLDQNRAVSILAEKVKQHSTDISNVIVWGNHSSTQFPDLSYCRVDGVGAFDVIDKQWYQEMFIPQVQNRGAEIIEARGLSSAASAASAAIDHMKDWVFGTQASDWVSMGVYSSGNYDINDGLVFSMPMHIGGGVISVIDDLAIDEFSQQMINQTEQELIEERDLIRDFLS